MKEEARAVVEAHIRWLEGEGNRQSIATALKWVLYYAGMVAAGPKSDNDNAHSSRH